MLSDNLIDSIHNVEDNKNVENCDTADELFTKLGI
jgi:hypothetical protein